MSGMSGIYLLAIKYVRYVRYIPAGHQVVVVSEVLLIVHRVIQECHGAAVILLALLRTEGSGQAEQADDGGLGW